MMDERTFGGWLRGRRSELKLSPFKLADALGYKRVSAIYNFEYGVAPLPMTKWPVMAQLLQLTLNEFVTVLERYEPVKVKQFRDLMASSGAAEMKAAGRFNGEESVISMEVHHEHTNGHAHTNGVEMSYERPQYHVTTGPEAYLPPAAAKMGVILPDPGEALIEGEIVPEEVAYEVAARKFIEAKVPIIYVGPLVLYSWSQKAVHKSRAVRILAQEIRSKIIPMVDYRPKYPTIDPAVEINPNHPNLTLWHNQNDVCMFIGVHCHYANLSLKIIRGGTSTYTIAVCVNAGHEDAMLSFRDATADKVLRLAETVRRLKGGEPDPAWRDYVYGEAGMPAGLPATAPQDSAG